MSSNNADFLPHSYFKELEIINNIEFTNREIDVLACIVHMRGASKIASILNISPRTAETHISNIKRKIDKTARENIIDFTEKSGKSDIIRKHYKYLLASADFAQKLANIYILARNKSFNYRIYCTENDGQKPITQQILVDLKRAGIKIEIEVIDKQNSITPKKNYRYRSYYLYTFCKIDRTTTVKYE